MAIWHGEKGKKKTGGEIKVARKKRKYELGSIPIYSKLGEQKMLVKRTKGGGEKVKAISTPFANVFNKKTRKTQKVKILDVIETPGNPKLARSGIIIKGAIVNTELGKAKITSRPSQHGVVNAVLIEEKS